MKKLIADMRDKLRKIIVCFLLLLSSFSYAEDGAKDLDIGVNYFSPPFIMRSGNNGFYGFDVSMMVYICKQMHRNCKFHSMRFEELLESVEKGKVDIALSAITITYARAQFVNFSDPYLLSTTRFLGQAKYKDAKLDKKFFMHKKIGIKAGTIFADLVKKLDLKKVKIVEYGQDNALVDAVSQGRIDLLLTDNETAVYWGDHSSNTLAALGKPIKYGFGYGVAINKKNRQLLDEINKALSRYHRSTSFKDNYHIYIKKF